MNKLILSIACMLLLTSGFAQQMSEDELSGLLDAWHAAAGRADFDAYFGQMTDDAVFIGTDATEYWKGQEFREFARPYFDRGRAWNFRAVERHIYPGPEGNLAWFDELLDTRMGLCRGSGVLKRVDGSWKIAHYVLSIAVPNENVEALLLLKGAKDSLLLQGFRKP